MTAKDDLAVTADFMRRWVSQRDREAPAPPSTDDTARRRLAAGSCRSVRKTATRLRRNGRAGAYSLPLKIAAITQGLRLPRITATTICETQGVNSRVQLMRHVLTLDLDLALVLPGLCKIVARLHAYPQFCGAAERLR
jgi:hypothetical protein